MSAEKMVRKQDEAAEKLDQRAVVAPGVDIFEGKDKILIVADLPGVDKEKLSIHFAKGQLTLEGQVSELGPDEEAFSYRRSFAVPQGIDTDKIQANLQNGVLRVSLPKQEALKPRQIAIRSN